MTNKPIAYFAVWGIPNWLIEEMKLRNEIKRRLEMAKAKGLAGYMIDFKKVKDMTVVDMFGKKPIAVTMLMKKLWAVIKSKNLKVD